MGLFGFSSRERRAAKSIRKRVAELTQTNDTSAGLVLVKLYMEGGPTAHIVAESDLYTLLTATLELHFEPGVNPHNHNKTSEIQFITAQVLRPQGPYWWSTPGLQDNEDPHGAVIFDWEMSPTLLWQREGAELPNWVRS